MIDLHKSVSASIQRRQKLQAKRITLGHKPDNHEGKQMQGGMVMDGVHSSLPLRNTNPYGFWSGVFFGKRRRRLCRFTPFYRTIPYIRTSLKTVPQRLLSYDPSSTMEAGPMTGDFFPPCSTTESAVLQFLFSWDSAYVPSCQTWSSSPAQARESCAFLLSVYTDFWAFSEIYSAGCGGGSSRRISFFYFRTVRFCLCIAFKF